jgi:hypothetical protein
VTAALVLVLVGPGLSVPMTGHRHGRPVPEIQAQTRPGPVVTKACQETGTASALYGLTWSGSLVRIDPATLRSEVVASGISPGGGLAVAKAAHLAYVTAPGPDGHPAIWAVPLNSCVRVSLVKVDAELPSLSPDLETFGYVTLDARGRQTGVAGRHD